MRNYILTLFIVLFAFACNNPEKEPQESDVLDAQIVFYNVENLFDTVDEAGKWDEEFTPNGEKKWDTRRYYKKLNDIAVVLDSIGKGELPDIICLQEVENSFVLEDLIQQKPFENNQYKIVHFESPDFRGIDNAVLYNPSVFKLLHKEAIAVNMPEEIAYIGENKITTRDHLYLKGILHKKDTLHIFVNHWTSMYYGAEETIPHRNFCAQILKRYTDSIVARQPHASIIIGGDLNENVFAPAALNHLEVDTVYNNIKNNRLYSLSYPLFTQRKQGTYNYRGEWGVLDHIIVSGALLKKINPTYTKIEWAHTFYSDMVMNFYDNKYGKGKRPNRTYVGNTYVGGYSDHLPVYLNLKTRL